MKGPDSCGLARNTCAVSTKAAASSRDYRRNARCCLAPKSRCCLAGRHCLPTADDRSSRARASHLSSRHFALGGRPCCAGSSAPVRWTDDSNCRSLAAHVHGQLHCPELPKCGSCSQSAARNYYSRHHSLSGSSLNVPKAAGSAQSRAAARSSRNLPAHYCRADSRTGRWSSCCYEHRSWPLGRSLPRRRSRAGFRTVRRL